MNATWVCASCHAPIELMHDDEGNEVWFDADQEWVCAREGNAITHAHSPQPPRQRWFQWDRVLDSRDVIAALDAARHVPPIARFPDEHQDFEWLTQLAAGAEHVADWIHGVELIRVDHFASYARELAEEVAHRIDYTGWPCRHIDWEAAAAELAGDYRKVDAGPHTYLVFDA
jgi:hypothetical protein